MARMFPATIGQDNSASIGERQVFNALRTYLPDDCLVFFNQPLSGAHLRHPDFIIVAPTTGIVVLEVKDWEAASIISMDNDKADLRTMGKEHRNPNKQAHDYMMSDLLPLLQKQPKLLEQDGKWQGRPRFNYGYGTVLTTIAQKDWEKLSFSGAIPAKHCIFRNELEQIPDLLT